MTLGLLREPSHFWVIYVVKPSKGVPREENGNIASAKEVFLQSTFTTVRMLKFFRKMELLTTH